MVAYIYMDANNGGIHIYIYIYMDVREGGTYRRGWAALEGREGREGVEGPGEEFQWWHIYIWM
jgi:hypothetical protein